jgi:hypothetical protein
LRTDVDKRQSFRDRHASIADVLPQSTAQLEKAGISSHASLFGNPT